MGDASGDTSFFVTRKANRTDTHIYTKIIVCYTQDYSSLYYLSTYNTYCDSNKQLFLRQEKLIKKNLIFVFIFIYNVTKINNYNYV
jgi:hypothetical protein